MTPDLQSYVTHREAVLDRVRTLLVERLHVEREPDTIDPDTPLFGTGLGLDSVDAVELVVSLEDTFGLQLPDDALGRRVMRTVGKLVDMVLSYEAAVAAGTLPEGFEASAEGAGSGEPEAVGGGGTEGLTAGESEGVRAGTTNVAAAGEPEGVEVGNAEQ